MAEYLVLGDPRRIAALGEHKAALVEFELHQMIGPMKRFWLGCRLGTGG